VEQLGDSVLQDHNRKSETGLWDGCIDACGLGHLPPHSPFQDDNGLPTHNLWLVIVILVASCSNQVEWKDTSVFCDLCRYALDYPMDSASRLLMHARQPRAPSHGWGSALHGVEAIARQKQLPDHLTLILLQYPYRMHHNTHQMASYCQVEPTQVQWWRASSTWEKLLYIVGFIWTWPPSLRVWSLAWRSWRSLGWINDNIPFIRGSYEFTLSILKTSN
jgi:hypothetical protein